jgi:hypothetical protein
MGRAGPGSDDRLYPRNHRFKEEEPDMQPDALLYLGRAIESAFDAAAYPALLALAVALLISAVRELRSHAQLRPAVARQEGSDPDVIRAIDELHRYLVRR